VVAKAVAYDAYLKGKIQKPLFCENCKQDKPLDKHHYDYKKKTKVIWLCRKCHSRLHVELKHDLLQAQGRDAIHGRTALHF